MAKLIAVEVLFIIGLLLTIRLVMVLSLSTTTDGFGNRSTRPAARGPAS